MPRPYHLHAAALLLSSVGFVQAVATQSPAVRRPATEAEEITLALSALPEGLRSSASVHVLGKTGYILARQGTSGINCLVERSRPDTQEPICWDAEGSDTILPLVKDKAVWRAAGLTEAQIERNASDGFASGKYRAPRRAGVAYMLSAENYVFNGKQVIKYHPHVMFYAPYLTNKDIGSDGKDPMAPWILEEGSPHAYVIVVTRHGR